MGKNKRGWGFPDGDGDPAGMGTGTNFNPRAGMGMGMGTIFLNGDHDGGSSPRPVAIPTQKVIQQYKFGGNI